MKNNMTPAQALSEFVRAQVSLGGCCRALEPLIELARAGDPHAMRMAIEAVRWMCEERE